MENKSSIVLTLDKRHPGISRPDEYKFNQDIVTVGRHPMCDLVLKETYISRQHVQFIRNKTKWFIMDLGSNNGTYLGSKRLKKKSRYPLINGQIVTLGTCKILISLIRTTEINEDDFNQTQIVQISDSLHEDTSIMRTDMFLEVREGKRRGEKIPLIPGSTVKIGRSKECDIQLSDKKVSREHAKLVCELSKMTLQDLASSGGTFVNREEIVSQTIKPGDQIKIGDNILSLIQVTIGAEFLEDPSKEDSQADSSPEKNPKKRDLITQNSSNQIFQKKTRG